MLLGLERRCRPDGFKYRFSTASRSSGHLPAIRFINTVVVSGKTLQYK